MPRGQGQTKHDKCPRCQRNNKRPGGKWCKQCHADYMRVWRNRIAVDREAERRALLKRTAQLKQRMRQQAPTLTSDEAALVLQLITFLTKRLGRGKRPPVAEPAIDEVAA